MQIKEFENIIETNNLRGLILDPISVIVDFNSELQVYNFVYPMRQIAKKRKCCIVFFRNEGKLSSQFKKAHIIKGTSLIPDFLRLMLISVRCHIDSSLHKRIKAKYPDEDIFVNVVTSQFLNSLMDKRAIIFSSKKIKVDGIKKPLWYATQEGFFKSYRDG